MSRAWTTLKVVEAGAVCHVTLTRDRINVPMVRELEELCGWLEDEATAAVVVFRGEGGNFSRGIDLGDFSLQRPPDIHGFHKWERALAAVERLKKVTVAVLDGDCIGGGVQLALACDFRLARHDAVLLLDEVKRGFLPGLATYRIAKYVGLGTAKHLVLSGRAVTAAEAIGMRLVDRVCAAEQVEAEIDRAVMEFLPVNGTAVALARRLLNESYGHGHEDFLGSFLAAQQVAITSEPFLRILRDRA